VAFDGSAIKGSSSQGLDKGPSPPVVSGALPFVGCGLAFARNPRKFLEDTRARVGDTFIVHAFGFRLFFTFSNTGLRSLYRVRESEASFTEATRGLLGLKLPPEATTGTLEKFHRGLRRPLVDKLLAFVDECVAAHVAALGASGEFEVFAHFKALVHRVGFLCWVGRDALRGANMQRLVSAFEILDPETLFKTLGSLVGTVATCKLRERRALRAIRDVLDEMWAARSEEERAEDADNLASLHAQHATLPPAQRSHQVAVDVFQLHMASQANMYAALSWTLINLLTRDKHYGERVLAEIAAARAAHGAEFTRNFDVLDQGLKFTEAFTHESLRLAQQSITLRKVMRPTHFEAAPGEVFELPPGMYLATLLSVTNLNENALPPDARARGAPPLSAFAPQRFVGSRLDPALYPPDAAYTVSTFGHGFHACPGMRFALCVAKVVLARYLSSLELEPRFAEPRMPPESVGAIGRASAPCVVRYARAS
jgi:cytochrome P450